MSGQVLSAVSSPAAAEVQGNALRIQAAECGDVYDYGEKVSQAKKIALQALAAIVAGVFGLAAIIIEPIDDLHKHW